MDGIFIFSCFFYLIYRSVVWREGQTLLQQIKYILWQNHHVSIWKNNQRYEDGHWTILTTGGTNRHIYCRTESHKITVKHPSFFMWYELCSKTFNADHAQFKGHVNVIAKLSVISSRNRSSSNIIPIDLDMKIYYVSVCTLYLRQNKLQFKINHQSRSTKVF